ncbi:MAG: phosphatase PAP2 family protein [Acidobacteriia bacterium]|nr:phosphatase PAP2 family protein [Terriglobia bacterium]
MKKPNEPAPANAPTVSLDTWQVKSRRIAAAAGVIVFAVVCALTLNRSFFEQIANNIFFSLTVAGCAILFVSVRPLREFPQVAAVGSILVGMQLFVLKVPLRALPALALLGMSSLLLLVIRRIWSGDEERPLLHYAIFPPLLFILLGYFGSGPLEITGRLHPKTLDLFLYSFDQSLGVQLSFKVGQVVLPSPLLTRAALAMYYVLPIAILFTYARQLVRDRNLAMTAFLSFLIAGPVGVVFYNLVPACGPAYLFGAKFPFEPLSMQQLNQLPLQALTIAGPRNAFPSLHLGWALLVWWYSEGLSRWAKSAAVGFLVGTVFATLGLGEHYFIDLVMAFPFALMIQAACALKVSGLDARRLIPLLTGLALMLVWVVLLRWGLPVVWINPVMPWLFVAGTIGLSIFLQARLRRVL